jgi:hypothetical protein
MISRLSQRVTSFLRRWREEKTSAVNTADNEAGLLISSAITAGVPFLAGRGGWMESYAAGIWRSGGAPEPGFLQKLHSHAGVFPATPGQLENFSSSYLDALASADLLGIMQSPFEGWLLTKTRAAGRRSRLRALEPYLSPKPWSACLRGRSVLVIHPFTASITSQYMENRDRLFADPEVLPEFQLQTLQAPQTMCGATGGFASWSDALEETRDKISLQQFDVAIVGCGAYGLPLAAFIKNALGKPVVHFGGATQLLFGISGERWRNRPEHAALMNEFWRPPREEERPPGWRQIEEGCYW